MQLTRRKLLRLGANSLGIMAVPGALLPLTLAPPAKCCAHVAEHFAKGKLAREQIGCFNRPWGKWSYDAALDAIKAAGYRLTGLLGNHIDEPFISVQATPGYLSHLKERIEARGLSVIVAWLRTSHDGVLLDSLAEARKQVDNAQRLGLKYLVTVGVDRAEQYDHYYRVMTDTAAYARERQIQIVLKPHGGCSASAEEILRCAEKVNHDNFRVWYDAGNIVHYTGKDPVVEVQRIAHLVTGFCAKDCVKQGGDVMISFGEGKVNFKTVLAKLQAAEFKGPVMVECCGGNTLPEVTAGARANREFLEQVYSRLRDAK